MMQNTMAIVVLFLIAFQVAISLAQETSSSTSTSGSTMTSSSIVSSTTTIITRPTTSSSTSTSGSALTSSSIESTTSTLFTRPTTTSSTSTSGSTMTSSSIVSSTTTIITRPTTTSTISTITTTTTSTSCCSCTCTCNSCSTTTNYWTTTTTSTLTTTSTKSTSTTTKSTRLNPLLTNWITNNATGYGGYQANVLKIYYNSTYAFISSNSIPSYSIGNWTANPNTPLPQNWTIAFPMSPTSAATKKETMMGVIGLWTNGMGIYNAKDGQSYNNQSVWNRNAYYWENVSFDSCYGHPDGNGIYHNHVNPKCMYNTSSSSHSPIIGWALDGFPIYGPFGWNSKRFLPSYKLRNITDRTTLPNGTSLSSTFYGPAIDSSYPLGSFIEDFEYSAGYGDLDQYNGRWGYTPEYPGGTYAYFIPTDSSGMPAYPYSIGPYFYGNVASTNRYQTIPDSAIKYYSYV